MGDNDRQGPDSGDQYIFADELPETNLKSKCPDTWKVLIADDEEEIHQMTKLVLSDYSFADRPIEFLSAYSGEETKKILRKNPDIAIILLDVVMETDDSGLETARYIRQTLQNKFVRIILRTGQPGKAPEQQVIMDYDINEYKEKTDLTNKKLFVTITTALRAFRDLTAIEKTRKVLELVIKSSEHLFAHQSLKKFTAGVLTQILTILNLDKNSLYLQNSAFAVSKDENDLLILAGTGQFENCVNNYVSQIVPTSIQKYLNEALEKQQSLFIDDAFIGYFCTESGSKNLLYLGGCGNLTDLEKDLIRIFSTNVAIAFDNIYLTQEIVDTQKEVIFTLGELVDTRSRGTANHVRRVAEFSRLLALKVGLDEKSAELLKLASPMHDVGKIGIPDSIINKPGILTDNEFDIVKTHSGIGYDILRKSKRDILKAATIVAQQHHERWDGAGYPRGLKGEEIHIYGRITCLADVFDALSHKRVYKNAWPMDKILAYIEEERGKHFDPNLIDIFMENQKEFLAINDLFPEEEAD